MLDTFPSCYCTETEKRYHIEKLNELRGSLYSKSVTFSKSRTFILSSHPELTGFSRANSLKTKFTRNQPMLFSSVQFSCSVVSDSLPPRELQHSRFPWWLSGKESASQAGDTGSIPGLKGRSPGRNKWQPTLVFLPGKSYGQNSLESYSPWGSQKSQTQFSS